MLGKKSVRVRLLVTLALVTCFVVPDVSAAAQNAGAPSAKRQRRPGRSRAKRTAVPTPTPAPQTGETTVADPTAVPQATQVGNQMNEQGEVGAQAKDNARETAPKGKRRARNRKFVPTPPPPAKPGQPSQQAGELAPTPAPAQPVKP